MTMIDASPLGKTTEYICTYTPALLFPIARSQSRQALLLNTSLPFGGVDIWTAYEVSWLNLQGKPQQAVVEFIFPCESEFIVESKSFKLYLNSFNQSKFVDVQQVTELLTRDLAGIVRAEVSIKLYSLASFPSATTSFGGELIDDLSVNIEHYHPTPELLTVGDEWVTESLVSELLKTNCPVTGQPDWASIQISYSGKKINRENLLGYIVSFRQHQDFHEHCVERIFMDVKARCQPEKLSVYARYTRRGGLDINPFRTTDAVELPEHIRLVRQ